MSEKTAIMSLELMWDIAPVALFLVGMVIGRLLEARRWREKGNHDYMNTIESSGRLYHVRAVRDDPT
jgi:hypothetical protein